MKRERKREGESEDVETIVGGAKKGDGKKVRG